MGWRDMEDFRSTPELPAAAETPIESYAREGKLMAGCLWGSSYLTKMIPKTSGKPPVKVFVLDAQKQKILLIKCGKICNAGKQYCPKHQMEHEAKEAAKPSGVR